MSIKTTSNNITLSDINTDINTDININTDTNTNTNVEGDVKIRDEIQIQYVEDIIDNFSYYKNKCFKLEQKIIKNDKIKTIYTELGKLKSYSTCSERFTAKRKRITRKYKLIFKKNKNKTYFCLYPNELLLLVDCSILQNSDSDFYISIENNLEDKFGGRIFKNTKTIKKYKKLSKSIKKYKKLLKSIKKL